MKEDDLVYGSHSAIQKGIRRGNLDLVKTAFDLMWPDPKHRNWLKWRLTILVEEDVWYMIGELAKFLKEVKALKGDVEEVAWRRFLYQVAICPKSKDSEGLLYTAMRNAAFEHPELDEMKLWLAYSSDLTHAAEAVLREAPGLSEYESAACSLLKARTSGGGMEGDRQACLATIVLITQRGLNEAQVKERMATGLERHKKQAKGKPKTMNLPWYAFDMHTAIGKWAMSIFMKRKALEYKGLTRKDLQAIWFLRESAWIPSDQINVIPFSKDVKLDSFTSMWWPVHVRDGCVFGDKSFEEVKDIWGKTMRQEMFDIVQWCMEKRE